MAMLAVQADHRQARNRIKLAISTGQTLNIIGHPGIGKTELSVAVAESVEYLPIVVRVPDYDAIDAKGMPYRLEVDGNTVTAYAAPAWFPRVGCGRVVIVLDDFAQASPSVQPAWARFMHEGILGEHGLPGFRKADDNGDHCVILMTCNPHTDRAASHRLPTYVANRPSHITLQYNDDEEGVKENVSQWSTWANANDVDGRVVSYVQFKNEDFYRFDPKQVEYAYPTARSWVAVSNDIKGLQSNDEEFLALVAGSWVGEGVGISFGGFCKSLELLPDLDDIISGKHTDVPVGAGLQYALVNFLSRRADEKNVEAIWAYLSGFDEDFQFLWYKTVGARKSFDISQTQVGVEAVVKFGDLLL